MKIDGRQQEPPKVEKPQPKGLVSIVENRNSGKYVLYWKVISIFDILRFGSAYLVKVKLNGLNSLFQ